MTDNRYLPNFSTKLVNVENLFMAFRHDVTQVSLETGAGREQQHFHNSCEIYVNVSGNPQFMVENNIYDISRGDIIIVRPNMFHQCLFKSSCLHEHFCIWLESPIESAVLDCFYQDNICNLISLPDEEKERFLSLCYLLKEVKDDPHKKTKCLSVLLDILSTIENFITIDTANTNSFPKIVIDSLNHINLNFKNIKSIKEIAEIYYVSQSTLDRAYKKHLNISPKKYLIIKKLLHAKELLENGTPTTTACFESGFNDCSYFTHIFKKHFHQTPSQVHKNKK
jgi:AraC-like DNA-binding protein